MGTSTLYFCANAFFLTLATHQPFDSPVAHLPYAEQCFVSDSGFRTLQATKSAPSTPTFVCRLSDLKKTA